MRFLVTPCFSLTLKTSGIGAIARTAPRDAPVIVPLDGTGVISGPVIIARPAQRHARAVSDADDAGKWAFSAHLHPGRTRSFAFRHLPHGALHGEWPNLRT